MGLQLQHAEDVVKPSEVSFDETPIRVGNKQSLLLGEDEFSNFQNDSKGQAFSYQQQSKPKFPYLRKGKGLQRYYKDPNQIVKLQYAPAASRKEPQCRNSNVGLQKQSLKLKQSEKPQSFDVKCHSENAVRSDGPLTHLLHKNSSDCKDGQDLQPVIPEHGCTWRGVLEQKNPLLSKPERFVQSDLYDDVSDGNCTLQKENQELVAFELLEQHAANSSFSSSSSFVTALMERAFGSTPKKSVPSDSVRGVEILKRNSEVHKQYAQNYNHYISMYPKFESQGALGGTENHKLKTDCRPEYKVVDNVASEEKSLHVHFADDDGSEPDVNDGEEDSSEKLDFKDESTWSNCSCSTDCSDDSQVETQHDGPNFPQVNNGNSAIDYNKYPSLSVKTLKGILSPTKKSNVSKIVCSTNECVPAQSKVGMKNSTRSVMVQTDDTEMVFKSELLMSRLHDLEKEIETFQKAKMELSKMKKEHEEDVRKFMKERKVQERKIKEEEERVKSMLEEERRRLGKERLVLQRHSKSLKNHPTKEEREEIQALKQQVAELQSEMHKKESRWTAFQVRSRDRTKCLEKENAKLKQEIKELKEQKQKQMKLYERPHKENPTRIMNYINKQIGLLATMNSNKTVNSENTNQLLKHQENKSACTESSSSEKRDSGKKVTCDKKSSGGIFTETIFPNGDIEQKFENGRVRFYYVETQIFQTTEVNGTEIYEFPNGQTEYHYTDGSKKVTFADGSIKLIHPTGTEEWALPDNTHWTVGSNGEKVVTLPNGDKEITTEDCMRREYSDGTVRILFPDGRIETRYPNGRLRVKNAEGQLILDLMETK